MSIVPVVASMTNALANDNPAAPAWKMPPSSMTGPVPIALLLAHLESAGRNRRAAPVAIGPGQHRGARSHLTIEPLPEIAPANVYVSARSIANVPLSTTLPVIAPPSATMPSPSCSVAPLDMLQFWLPVPVATQLALMTLNVVKPVYWFQVREIQRPLPATAELEDVRRPHQEHYPGDVEAGSEGQRVCPGGELYRRSAAADDGPGIEDAHAGGP